MFLNEQLGGRRQNYTMSSTVGVKTIGAEQMTSKNVRKHPFLLTYLWIVQSCQHSHVVHSQ